MDEHGYASARRVNRDPSMRPEPLHRLLLRLRAARRSTASQAGLEAPWRLHQNYARDILTLRYGDVDDGAMVFSSPDRAADPQRVAA